MRLRSIGTIAAVWGLAGCAARGAVARAPTSEVARVDQAKMARVDGSARLRGIEVIWVNPPTTSAP